MIRICSPSADPKYSVDRGPRVRSPHAVLYTVGTDTHDVELGTHNDLSGVHTAYDVVRGVNAPLNRLRFSSAYNATEHNYQLRVCDPEL